MSKPASFASSSVRESCAQPRGIVTAVFTLPWTSGESYENRVRRSGHLGCTGCFESQNSSKTIPNNRERRTIREVSGAGTVSGTVLRRDGPLSDRKTTGLAYSQNDVDSFDRTRVSSQKHMQSVQPRMLVSMDD